MTTAPPTSLAKRPGRRWSLRKVVLKPDALCSPGVRRMMGEPGPL